ncbi:MAG: hypothetical protein K9J13_12060 [Saprospiraceae bacterium]|nr:hypothetical protein [Saprospiraceae bacterium]
MTTRKLTFLILILVSVISCNKKTQTDEKVITEIFPQLIDSLRISKSNLIPPPPPPIFDKDSNFIGVDSIAAKDIEEKHKQIIREIDSIDSRLLIGLLDTCLSIDFSDLRQRTYSDSQIIQKIILDNNQIQKSLIKWNLESMQMPSDFQLMFKSDLIEKYSDIWRINDRKFGGLIAISRIYYDNDKKTGLFQFESYPFYHEGVSYFVIIMQIDGKWKIKKILMNWIT